MYVYIHLDIKCIKTILLYSFEYRDIIGYGTKDFQVKEMLKKESNDMIIKNHYSHKVAGFATTYIYLGVFFKTNKKCQLSDF